MEKEIIELFISEYSGMEIKNNLQKKKIQERILVTLCILCFFCSLGSLGYMYYQENYQPSFKNEPQYILENGATIPLKNIQND